MMSSFTLRFIVLSCSYFNFKFLCLICKKKFNPNNRVKFFIKYFNYCKTEIQKIIRYNTNRQLDVVSISSAFYKPEDIAHPIAQKFGCEIRQALRLDLSDWLMSIE